jgi:hypothetical protein
MPDFFDGIGCSLQGALGARAFALFTFLGVGVIVVRHRDWSADSTFVLIGRCMYGVIAAAGFFVALRYFAFCLRKDFGTVAFLSQLSEPERAGMVVLFLLLALIATGFSVAAALQPTRPKGPPPPFPPPP